MCPVQGGLVEQLRRPSKASFGSAARGRLRAGLPCLEVFHMARAQCWQPGGKAEPRLAGVNLNQHRGRADVGVEPLDGVVADGGAGGRL